MSWPRPVIATAGEPTVTAVDFADGCLRGITAFVTLASRKLAESLAAVMPTVKSVALQRSYWEGGKRIGSVDANSFHQFDLGCNHRDTQRGKHGRETMATLSLTGLESGPVPTG